MRTAISCVLAAVWLPILVCGCKDEPTAFIAPETMDTAETGPADASSPLYAFELADIDGAMTRLGSFEGRVLLLVNVASKCGYTRQYAGLQALYEKYRERGLVILGFPANDFGAQEPGTNEQIKQFCSVNYGVTFPIFAKISVKGDRIHPLYQFLTNSENHPDFGGDIAWNFTKFLVSREGRVIGRYEPAVEPSDVRLVSDIETALGAGGQL